MLDQPCLKNLFINKPHKADSTLTELFDRVVPNDTIVDLPPWYYLADNVLCWKWVPHGEFVIGNPMFQVIVPQSLRQVVLQIARYIWAFRSEKVLQVASETFLFVKDKAWHIQVH